MPRDGDVAAGDRRRTIFCGVGAEFVQGQSESKCVARLELHRGAFDPEARCAFGKSFDGRLTTARRSAAALRAPARTSCAADKALRRALKAARPVAGGTPSRNVWFASA